MILRVGAPMHDSKNHPHWNSQQDRVCCELLARHPSQGFHGFGLLLCFQPVAVQNSGTLVYLKIEQNEHM